MKRILVASILVVSLNAHAQKANRHTPVLQRGLYLSFNPHSLLEPEQGAVGMGIGYRINKHIEVWAEASYLYRGIDADEYDFRNLHGIRGIISGKYYYSTKHGFFVGAEFRIKEYTFKDENTFINTQINDTLTNYPYKPRHTLVGGGVFWGKRFKLTRNGKFELEGNLGAGVKHRFIERKNVPAGYSKMEYFLIDRQPFAVDTDREETLPYFPATVRFIFHL